MNVNKKALHVKPGGAFRFVRKPKNARPQPPRVACYLRVSSRAQDYATQLDACMRASTARGDQIATLYEEKVSSRAAVRPELVRLRTDAQAGRVSKVYVFKLDRLTRNGIRDTFELVEELQRHGAKVVTVADGFDLEGPSADLVMAMLAWAAKMERAAISERIAAARLRIEAEGGRWGRPSELTRGVREKIQDMRTRGASIRAIAIALKIPRATVGRAVKQGAQP